MATKKRRLPLMYKSYVFKGDKDPVIDHIHTMIEDEGLNYNKVHELSGVASSTLYNWIEGDTKRPQYCTIAAVAGALGYEMKWVKSNVVSLKRRRMRSRNSAGMPIAAHA